VKPETSSTRSDGLADRRSRARERDEENVADDGILYVDVDLANLVDLRGLRRVARCVVHSASTTSVQRRGLSRGGVDEAEPQEGNYRTDARHTAGGLPRCDLNARLNAGRLS
jgi:hypothetical protein